MSSKSENNELKINNTNSSAEVADDQLILNNETESKYSLTSNNSSSKIIIVCDRSVETCNLYDSSIDLLSEENLHPQIVYSMSTSNLTELRLNRLAAEGKLCSHNEVLDEYFDEKLLIMCSQELPISKDNVKKALCIDRSTRNINLNSHILLKCTKCSKSIVHKRKKLDRVPYKRYPHRRKISLSEFTTILKKPSKSKTSHAKHVKKQKQSISESIAAIDRSFMKKFPQKLYKADSFGDDDKKLKSREFAILKTQVSSSDSSEMYTDLDSRILEKSKPKSFKPMSTVQKIGGLIKNKFKRKLDEQNKQSNKKQIDDMKDKKSIRSSKYEDLKGIRPKRIGHQLPETEKIIEQDQQNEWIDLDEKTNESFITDQQLRKWKFKAIRDKFEKPMKHFTNSEKSIFPEVGQKDIQTLNDKDVPLKIGLDKLNRKFDNQFPLKEDILKQPKININEVRKLSKKKNFIAPKMYEPRTKQELINFKKDELKKSKMKSRGILDQNMFKKIVENQENNEFSSQSEVVMNENQNAAVYIDEPYQKKNYQQEINVTKATDILKKPISNIELEKFNYKISSVPRQHYEFQQHRKILNLDKLKQFKIEPNFQNILLHKLFEIRSSGNILDDIQIRQMELSSPPHQHVDGSFKEETLSSGFKKIDKNSSTDHSSKKGIESTNVQDDTKNETSLSKVDEDNKNSSLNDNILKKTISSISSVWSKFKRPSSSSQLQKDNITENQLQKKLQIEIKGQQVPEDAISVATRIPNYKISSKDEKKFKSKKVSKISLSNGKSAVLHRTGDSSTSIENHFKNKTDKQKSKEEIGSIGNKKNRIQRLVEEKSISKADEAHLSDDSKSNVILTINREHRKPKIVSLSLADDGENIENYSLDSEAVTKYIPVEKNPIMTQQAYQQLLFRISRMQQKIGKVNGAIHKIDEYLQRGELQNVSHKKRK